VLLSSVLIPGGTYISGDVITVEAMFRKTGTVGSSSVYFSYNTTNALGTSWAQNALITNTIISIPLYRRMGISVEGGTGDGTGTYPLTSNYMDVTSSTAKQTLTINWQNDVYIIAAALVANVSDRIRCDYLKVSNY
jgi:hypothetical protein